MECTTPRVNPHADCGLWVILMSRWRFLNYNKCTSLVPGINNGGDYACGTKEGMENLCTFLLICCEPNKRLKK